jgi:two-component sensor histidine kinase
MWSPLAALRGAIDEKFPGVEPDVLDAVRMAVGELGENVLKYGEPVDGVAGRVTVSRTADGVEIRAVSRLTDPRRTERVVGILSRIAAGCDLRASFEARMLQIIEHPDEESTGLGLLRIAYEGLFELSYRHVDGTLTLVAARSIV